MKLTVRQVLGHSHIAAIAIAVLILWAIKLALYPLIFLLFGVGDEFILSLRNFFSPHYVPFDWREPLNFLYVAWLRASVGSILNAVLYVAVAFLLARWVYGHGPLRSLRKCGEKLAGRAHCLIE
jgi:ABC-type phosphate/phosphonate transport system permease subunit